MIVEFAVNRILNLFVDKAWSRYGPRMKQRFLMKNAQFFVGQISESNELPSIKFVIPRFYPEHYRNQEATNSTLWIRLKQEPEDTSKQEYRSLSGAWEQNVPLYSEFLSNEDVLAAKVIALAVPERLKSQAILSPDEYHRKEYVKTKGPTVFIGSPRSNPSLSKVFGSLDIELEIDLDLVQKNSQRFVRIRDRHIHIANARDAVAVIGRYADRAEPDNVKIFVIGDSAANTLWAAERLAATWEELQHKFPNGGNCIQVFKGPRPMQGEYQRTRGEHLMLTHEIPL